MNFAHAVGAHSFWCTTCFRHKPWDFQMHIISAGLVSLYFCKRLMCFSECKHWNFSHKCIETLQTYRQLCSVSQGILKGDTQSKVQFQSSERTALLDVKLVSSLLDGDLQVVMGSQLPLDHVNAYWYNSVDNAIKVMSQLDCLTTPCPRQRLGSEWNSHTSEYNMQKWRLVLSCQAHMTCNEAAFAL